MKICIPLRDTPGTDLRSGNLRSESRWERLALEACLANPKVTEVYTFGYEWQNGNKISPKYKGSCSVGSKDKILLTQDCNPAIVSSAWRAAICNIFHGPWTNQVDTIKAISNDLQNNLLFVIGHPCLFGQTYNPNTGEIRETGVVPGDSFTKEADRAAGFEGCGNFKYRFYLLDFVPADQLFYLPLPWIPQSAWKDRFNNNVLLHAGRHVFFSELQNDLSIRWALDEMLQDSSLQLHILTGWQKEDQSKIPTYDGKDVSFPNKEINEYFWQCKEFLPYITLQERVSLFYGISWAEVLSEFDKAKLQIIHVPPFGGTAMEASMHGVPFVGRKPGEGMGHCPGYLYTPDSIEATKILKHLMTDHDFYLETAKNYHDYAMTTYSFDTFNVALNRILQTRGLL